MFPPVEASVLAENPDFASLYTTLTTEVLNADGTTRVETDSKARGAVREVSPPRTISFLFALNTRWFGGRELTRARTSATTDVRRQSDTS